MKKEVGIIGLGKMGGNVARRLSKKGWKVYGYNRTSEVTKKLEKEGVKGIYSLEDLISKLQKPRVIITILTSGKPTDQILEKLVKLLEPNDIIAEFSNSLYTDSQRRSKMLAKHKIKFIDVGISGGPGGALNGACLMVGGDKKVFQYIEPLLKDEAAPKAYMHFPGIGAGHFTKMVHNGIEYGMMQSIAEGFELLKKSPYKLDLKNVVHIYNNQSVVESRLTKWLEKGFEVFGENLKDVSSWVPRGGEGDWTVQTARKLGVEVKIIKESVRIRKESEKKDRFAGKVLNTMRNIFGGHSIERGKIT